MAHSGIWWFKLDLDVFRDTKVRDLVEAHGAEGAGAWLAVMVEMHAAINDGVAFVPAERLVESVAFDLHISRRKARNLVNSLADVGLIDREMWDDGKAANERVAERYEAYRRKCEIAEIARSARLSQTGGGDAEVPSGKLSV
ncbi:MAG: Lin1244/Lin1753 domain-containing protein [Atopobiaceae bacterium]